MLHLCGMLTIGKAFYRLKEGLMQLYDEGEATAIAHEAMEHLTGKPRLERLSAKAEVMSEAQYIRFLEMELRLQSGEPIQYITRVTCFLGRRFQVSNAVLIPRPETEELVQWILSECRPKSILDIGSGSGCIAISLRLGATSANVQAIDVSETALDIARKNAAALNADVHFTAMNFLDEVAWQGLGLFDVIVSNPPYIPISERGALHRNVRDHEPETALFVPADDALLFYRTIARFGLQHLLPGGRIYCELHRDYAGATQALFEEAGYKMAELRNDLFGAPRMLRMMR